MEAGRHPHRRVPCLNVKSSGVIVARADRRRLVGVFTPADREQLRKELIEAAHADDDVVGAALVGSAATGREDTWSDIDLVLQVRRDTDPAEVASRWTAEFYDLRGAAHHLDVIAGGVLYRVFLLASSLQIDVSFWPEDQFRATESGFTLLFGTPQPSTEPREPEASHEIGMAWLYALHSRSAIARGRVWQATMMLDHLRDQLLVLACIRHGLNLHHGRDADRLPVLPDRLTAGARHIPGRTRAGPLAHSSGQGAYRRSRPPRSGTRSRPGRATGRACSRQRSSPSGVFGAVGGDDVRGTPGMFVHSGHRDVHEPVQVTDAEDPLHDLPSANRCRRARSPWPARSRRRSGRMRTAWPPAR